ncbi:MAG: parallel beta-helix domain-containing protein [Parvularculaceae bacterium]|nr:right-handed parallel beta-helix repeat-containing protein [Parvularculaceae bacterium]
MTPYLRAAVLAPLALAGCGRKEAAPAPSAADASYKEKLIAQLIDASPGDVIEIPEGRFSFDRSLSLAVDGVTIRGAGMDKTVLSFRDQIAGAEGLLVTASDFTIEDLAIEDTKGDALKVNEGENIIIRRVRTEWTGEPKTENGAYGIYPVQTRNVLLESNVAIGASDAGIYVGQSQNVIVRYNRAEKNVAGIEIENTFDADVYENIATDNTGGILIFNMPNLSQPGARTRIFNNEANANNRKNFGHPGTPVATIPAGSGVVVNSNDRVEIFDNDIRDNKTANIIIASVFSSGLSRDGMSADFDGYPEGVYVYANRMGGGGKNPDGLDLQALKLAKFGPMGAIPDVLWDGYVDPAKQVDGRTPASLRVCIDNDAAEVLNVDAPNKFADPQIVTDEVRCALEKLPAVSLANGLGN